MATQLLVVASFVFLFICGQLNAQSISIRESLFDRLHIDADSTTLDVVYTDNTYTKYNVTVNGVPWISSGMTGFRNNGKWQSLQFKETLKSEGEDGFGFYNDFIIIWNDTSRNEYATVIRCYPNAPDIILFIQSFISGTNGATTNNPDAVISSYPSFILNNNNLGWIKWGGRQLSGTTIGRFGNQNTGNLTGGRQWTGPIAIFNQNMDDCIVLSPFTDHMVGSMYTSIDNTGNNETQIQFGLIGNISNVDPGYSIKFILTTNKDGGGVNQAMRSWGDKSLKYYNKQRGNAHLRDFTLNYLGYSTDNGAYYYYETEANKNYQQTMIDIKTYHNNNNLPTKYVLLDSWWYYKGEYNGCKNWTAMPSIFPDGMKGVFEGTGWFIQAHNRFWSVDNVYANNIPHQKEKGNFTFTWSHKASLPTQQSFWNYLFDINNDWGLIVYEQDWLSTVETEIPLLLNTTWFARQWLMQMANAARNHNINIQYCMDYPRHIMTSVELETVTQARASHDYHPGNDQWQIGLSSIFASAIDIAPSKDSYWSMNTPQAGHYPNGTYEPFNRLQSAVLSLSNGPVTFSDRIGYSDTKLIMKCCSSNGLLLRPDTSATMIDNYFIDKSGLNSNSSQSFNDGRIWSTTSLIDNNERYRFLYVFGVLFDQDYTLYPSDINYHLMDNTNNRWIVSESNSSMYSIFGDNQPLTIKQGNEFDFQLYTLIPIGNSTTNLNIWYLAGEVDKWITCSQQRFKEISTNNNDGDIYVRIQGEVGEVVNVAFVNGISLEQKIISCTIGETEQMILQMPQQTCKSY